MNIKSKKYRIPWVYCSGIALMITAHLNTACQESKDPNTYIIKGNPIEDRALVITPLGRVNPLYIQWTKEALEKTYKMPIKVEKSLPLKPEYFYPSNTKRNRLNADQILNIFKSFDEIPVLITEVDIGHKRITKNDTIDGYGIIGKAKLGKRRQNSPTKDSELALIISTSRIKKTTKDNFRKRLNKVTIHEIGHNLSLPHCKYQSTCVMVDARGKVTTIDKANETFCDQCRKIIQPFLRATE
jgi:archaemetzincin